MEVWSKSVIKKTEGKILNSINKDNLKQAPNLGDLILTRI